MLANPTQHHGHLNDYDDFGNCFGCPFRNWVRFMMKYQLAFRFRYCDSASLATLIQSPFVDGFSCLYFDCPPFSLIPYAFPIPFNPYHSQLRALKFLFIAISL